MEKKIEPERITPLNSRQTGRGAYVLYWMQASQRAEYNHALEFAVERANQLKQPLLVYFGLTESFPEANERHYQFMLEGLAETRNALKDRGIGMVLLKASPESGVSRLSGKASLIVCDRGYLNIQKRWRKQVARSLEVPLLQVETDTVVPAETASPKEEYSAATFRRKLMPSIPAFLQPVERENVAIDSTAMGRSEIDLSRPSAAGLNVDHSVPAVDGYRGGASEARRRLEQFISYKLSEYAELKNDPTADSVSHLGPYLHFGQISPVQIALSITSHAGPGPDAFLEELVVRRELAINFVHYNPRYDQFAGLPAWAVKNLQSHSDDDREYVYSLAELEKAVTHDRYWNAAQTEMVTTGFMHGYMRMYWGKKIIEWSNSPEEAFSRTLHLNNKYQLDGRDPNSFAGVAWCFGKHDRPWASRPIFGNVRYMNSSGLKHKFDIDRYAAKYENLSKQKRMADA